MLNFPLLFLISHALYHILKCFQIFEIIGLETFLITSFFTTVLLLTALCFLQD